MSSTNNPTPPPPSTPTPQPPTNNNNHNQEERGLDFLKGAVVRNFGWEVVGASRKIGELEGKGWEERGEWVKEQFKDRGLFTMQNLFGYAGLVGLVLGIRRGHLYGLNKPLSPTQVERYSRGRFILNCMGVESARTGCLFAVRYSLMGGCFVAGQLTMEAIREKDDYLNGFGGGGLALFLSSFPYGVGAMVVGGGVGGMGGMGLMMLLKGGGRLRGELEEVRRELEGDRGEEE